MAFTEQANRIGKRSFPPEQSTRDRREGINAPPRFGFLPNWTRKGRQGWDASLQFLWLGMSPNHAGILWGNAQGSHCDNTAPATPDLAPQLGRQRETSTMWPGGLPPADGTGWSDKAYEAKAWLWKRVLQVKAFLIVSLLTHRPQSSQTWLPSATADEKQCLPAGSVVSCTATDIPERPLGPRRPCRRMDRSGCCCTFTSTESLSIFPARCELVQPRQSSPSTSY